jgi:hypothetical protein
VLVRVTQESGLAGEAEQRLHHRQGDDLGIGDPWLDPDGGSPWDLFGMGLQQIVVVT